MHEMATRAISLLRTLESGLDVNLEQEEAYCVIHLPSAPDAEYRFILYVYSDGEPQICATLNNGSLDDSFRYSPFEEPAYKSRSERDEAFLAAVEQLVTSPTRISQRRGLMFVGFRCDVLKASGWARVGPHINTMRWGAKIPATSTRVVYYESPALIDV